MDENSDIKSPVKRLSSDQPPRAALRRFKEFLESKNTR